MAEIEDEGPTGKSMQDVVNLAVERRSAGEERDWIEVTLDGDGVRNLAASEGTVDGPVEAKGVDRRLFDIS